MSVGPDFDQNMSAGKSTLICPECEGEFDPRGYKSHLENAHNYDKSRAEKVYNRQKPIEPGANLGAHSGGEPASGQPPSGGGLAGQAQDFAAAVETLEEMGVVDGDDGDAEDAILRKLEEIEREAASQPASGGGGGNLSGDALAQMASQGVEPDTIEKVAEISGDHQSPEIVKAKYDFQRDLMRAERRSEMIDQAFDNLGEVAEKLTQSGLASMFSGMFESGDAGGQQRPQPERRRPAREEPRAAAEGARAGQAAAGSVQESLDGVEGLSASEPRDGGQPAGGGGRAVDFRSAPAEGDPRPEPRNDGLNENRQRYEELQDDLNDAAESAGTADEPADDESADESITVESDEGTGDPDDGDTKYGPQGIGDGTDPLGNRGENA